MAGHPGIESIGDRHEWPTDYWGWRDWSDETRARSEAIGYATPTAPGDLDVGRFSLYDRPKPPPAVPERRHQSARIDALLAAVGIRPR
jgi:hypothetical protein